MKKKIVALGLAVIMAVGALTGCGSGNSNDSAKEEKKTVRLGIMTTGFTVSLNYAVEKKYFEELGLDVQVVNFPNGPAINEAIASGEIDIAGIGEMPSITGALNNSSKIVAWMTDDEASILSYARNDSDIVKAGKGNIADYPEIYGTADTWKGKEIVVAKGTSSHYGLLATLGTMGLSESDVTITNMEGASGATAFAAGTGDVFYGFDPQWAEFYKNPDQYTQVASCTNSGRSLYTVLIASDDFAKNHGDEVTAVIQGMLKAEMEFKNDKQVYYDAMYEWQNTYGKCEEALAQFSADIKEIKDLDAQKAMFEEKDGTTAVNESLLQVAQFMVDNSVISADDKKKLEENNPVVSEYLFKAIENIQK